MKVQRPVREDVGLEQLETVRVYFYILKDPRTQEVRYVGQTVNPTNRFRNHIWESKTKNVTHKHKWIVSLLRRNLHPVMEIIGEGFMTSKQADRLESSLLKRYNKAGRLTNLLDRGRNQSVIVTKPINQYTLQGVWVARFPNANQAGISLGVNDAGILAVATHPNGRGNRSRHGFLWAFDGEVPTPLETDYRRACTAKSVVQKTKKGEVVEIFMSARMASEKTGVCHKRISAAVTGRQKTAGGFLWSFV